MKNQEVTIDKFAAEVLRKVRETLGSDFDVEIEEITKNNGVKLTGVIIKNGRINIAPIIYLDGLYRNYLDGMKMEVICRQIIRIFENERLDKSLDVSTIWLFDKVKDRVCWKLVNAEKNRELLEKSPHVLLHDLAVVAYITVFDSTVGEGTVTVNNKLMDMWCIEKDELFSYARENTRRLGANVEHMSQVLGQAFVSEDLSKETDEKLWTAVREGWGMPMYVASNDKRIHGAAVILDEEFLRDFAERVGNFYILPSSVHEVLFLPAKGMNANDLRSMVQEVNQTQVSPEEVLSDSVYFYNKETGRVEIA